MSNPSRAIPSQIAHISTPTGKKERKGEIEEYCFFGEIDSSGGREED